MRGSSLASSASEEPGRLRAGERLQGVAEVPGPLDDPAAVLAPFRRVIEELRTDHPEVRIDVTIREWTDAAEASPDERIVRLARAAVAEAGGGPPAAVGFSGITDARYYLNQAKIPTVILGPGSITVAHTADEWVAVDELAAAARAYARLFVGFLGV